jgi:hypothetical protein
MSTDLVKSNKKYIIGCCKKHISNAIKQKVIKDIELPNSVYCASIEGDIEEDKHYIIFPEMSNYFKVVLHELCHTPDDINIKGLSYQDIKIKHIMHIVNYKIANIDIDLDDMTKEECELLLKGTPSLIRANHNGKLIHIKDANANDKVVLVHRTLEFTKTIECKETLGLLKSMKGDKNLPDKAYEAYVNPVSEKIKKIVSDFIN